VNLLHVTHLSPGVGIAGLLTGLTGAAGGAGGLLTGLADGWGMQEAAYQAVGVGLFYTATAGIVFGGSLILLRSYTTYLEAARIEMETQLREQAGFGEPEPEPEPEPRLSNHNGIYIDNGGYAIKAMRSKHKRKTGQVAPSYATDAHQQIIGRVALDQTGEGATGQDVMWFDVSRGMWQMSKGLDARGWKITEEIWVNAGNPFSQRQFRGMMKYMEGRGLAQRRGRGKNSPRELTNYGRRIMQTLRVSPDPRPTERIEI
jgi:hypothetical protein